MRYLHKKPPLVFFQLKVIFINRLFFSKFVIFKIKFRLLELNWPENFLAGLRPRISSLRSLTFWPSREVLELLLNISERESNPFPAPEWELSATWELKLAQLHPFSHTITACENILTLLDDPPLLISLMLTLISSRIGSIFLHLTLILNFNFNLTTFFFGDPNRGALSLPNESS